MSRQFPSPIKKLRHDTAVYLAGIVDGEGCFYIGKSEKSTGTYYQPQFKIVLVDEPTIAWIADELGRGYTHQKAAEGKNHKDTYTVRISDRAGILAFVPQILPYMILKRAVALNIWEFCSERDAYEKMDTAHEQKMYTKNRELNRVGVIS